MALCDLCEGININSVVPFYALENNGDNADEELLQVCYQHHRTFNELKRSAERCEMCNMMCQTLERKNQDQPDLEEAFKSSEQSFIWLISGETMFYDLTLPKYLSQLRVNVGNYGRMQSVDLLVYTDPGDPLYLSGDIVGRQPASNSDCPEVKNIMRQWLSDCLDNHPECKSALSRHTSVSDWTQDFPARLLFLNQDGATELIETDGRDYKYAALSYCWGKSHPVITTRENYGQLIHGFGKTLQDATKIAIDLGLSYLWIDALCIIQDDNDDWQREASKMASIYRNAQVTISATAASDTSVGCLAARPPPLVEPVELRSRCSNSDLVGRMIVCPKVGSIEEVLDRSPLNNRGWCLQERVLSHRIIHFAQDQLYWECETVSQAEDGMNLGVTSCFKRQLSSVNSDHTVLRSWHNLVDDYSQRLLTHRSDILPALAGLADVVRQHLTDPTYYAGIWKQDLPFGLLWSTPVAKTATVNPSFRAPSWSWAAVSGHVVAGLRAQAMSLTIDRELAEIVEIDARLRNPSFALGEVEDGALIICGRARDIALPLEGNSYAQRPWKASDGQMIVLDDEGKDIGDMTFDDHSRSYPTKLTVIMICSGINLSRSVDRYPASCFLALEPSGASDTYIRIGAGRVRSNQFFNDSPMTTIKIL